MSTDKDQPSKTLLLTIVLVSYSMIVIDNSIIITGLPLIQHGLGFSKVGLSWVQNAYMLTFGGLMLLGARAGDMFGRRLVFIVGLAIFTAASLAIGLAASPAWLISARAVQGVGAAILAPSTLALLSAGFEEGPERIHALGWYGAIGGITASVGLVAGGVVADLISWRAGFFINVPIGLALIWASRRYIVETPRRKGSLDIYGAILSTLGMTALVFGLIHAAEESWAHWGTAGSLLAGVALLTLFVFSESRAKQPILPLRLFASRQRLGANMARMLFTGAAMGFFFYMTQYLQDVLGLRPLWAGMVFFPSMLANFLVALTVSRLVRRTSLGAVTAGTIAVSIVGMAWLGQVDANTPFWFGVIVPMLLVGAGMGAGMASLTISGVSGVAKEDTGAASGLVGVAHQLGGALGLAIMVVVFAAGAPAVIAEHALLAHRIGTALSAGAVMLTIALLIVLATIVRGSSIKPRVTNDNSRI